MSKKAEMELLKDDILNMFKLGIAVMDIARKINHTQCITRRYLHRWQERDYTRFCLDCVDFEECKREGWKECPYKGMNYANKEVK